MKKGTGPKIVVNHLLVTDAVWLGTGCVIVPNYTNEGVLKKHVAGELLLPGWYVPQKYVGLRTNVFFLLLICEW